MTLSLSSLQTTVDFVQVSFIGTEERRRCREVANCGEVTVSRGGFFFFEAAITVFIRISAQPRITAHLE